MQALRRGTARRTTSSPPRCRAGAAPAVLIAAALAAMPAKADDKPIDDEAFISLLNLSDGGYMAQAEKAFEVRYRFALSGASIGKASIVAVFDGDHYTTLGSASTGGVLQKFASSDVRVGSKGVLGDLEPRPELYNAELYDRDRRQLVRLPYDRNGPGTTLAHPPYDLDRNPVSDDQKLETVDPIAALLSISVGNGKSNDAPCGGRVKVYDGKRRYDIVLNYLRTEVISVGRPDVYKGPALRCEIHHEEIAGFKKKNRDPKEWPPWNVWLAPLADGEFSVPVRLVAHTPFGTGVLSAYKIDVKLPAD